MRTNIRNKAILREAEQNDLDFIYESLENLACEQKIGDRFHNNIFYSDFFNWCS